MQYSLRPYKGLQCTPQNVQLLCNTAISNSLILNSFTRIKLLSLFVISCATKILCLLADEFRSLKLRRSNFCHSLPYEWFLFHFDVRELLFVTFFSIFAVFSSYFSTFSSSLSTYFGIFCVALSVWSSGFNRNESKNQRTKEIASFYNDVIAENCDVKQLKQKVNRNG